MPRITPLVATHRVTIDYKKDGLPHKTQFLCSAVPSSSGPSFFQFVTFDASTLEVDTAVQHLATLLADLFNADDAVFSQYVLEQYAGGAYNPIWANSLSNVGTQSGTYSKYNRETAVFRDSNNIKVRNVVLGVNLIAPQRGSIAGTSGTFHTYFVDFLTFTGNHLGNWVTGRSGTRFTSGLNYTVSLDRKSRRRAGVL